MSDDPMFVMSMYANKQTLYKAKADYYMKKTDQLRRELDLIVRIANEREEQIQELERKLYEHEND